MHQDALQELVKPGEGWIEHHDYPGYLVGVHGAVISLHSKPKPRILSLVRNGRYYGYRIKHRDGLLRSVYLHRLVAEVIYGPANGLECCHNDGNPKNCDFTNLRWATHVENEADKRRHGTRRVGERNHLAKLSAVDVRAMREIRQTTGAFYREIGKQFGVTTMTAYRAVTGQSWEHLK